MLSSVCCSTEKCNILGKIALFNIKKYTIAVFCMLQRIEENLNLYASYKDLNTEDKLRMDILRKINPCGFDLLKSKVEKMINKK